MKRFFIALLIPISVLAQDKVKHYPFYEEVQATAKKVNGRIVRCKDQVGNDQTVILYVDSCGEHKKIFYSDKVIYVTLPAKR